VVVCPPSRRRSRCRHQKPNHRNPPLPMAASSPHSCSSLYCRWMTRSGADLVYLTFSRQDREAARLASVSRRTGLH
jgi:hypothetical protein